MPFDVRKPKTDSLVVIRAASAHELSAYEKYKLNNIEENAQENKIEVIKLNVNGTKLPTSISNKEVEIDLGELALHDKVAPRNISPEDLFFINCALADKKMPTIEQPLINTVVEIMGGGEIGSYITGVTWDNSFVDGSYQFGSAENPDDTSTGLTIKDVTWLISNDIDSQTSTAEDGIFEFKNNRPQIDTEALKTYATIKVRYSLDAEDARTPVNNIGEEVPGKILSITNKLNTVFVKASGYYKPFWGYKMANEVLDIDNITSAQVRELTNSGEVTNGLPTTTANEPYNIPVGVQQIFFLAKAGVYSKLTATDAESMNAKVTFTKKTNALSVEGANGFPGTDYDMWYIDWGEGIDVAKSLVLTWE